MKSMISTRSNSGARVNCLPCWGSSGVVNSAAGTVAGAGTVTVFGGTYSGAPVPGFIASILRKFRSADSNYLLSGSGNALEPRTLQRRFKSILKKAGLPSVSYHSLRHAFATNCLQAGFDVKTLSEILGHASVKTTLDRYVHTSMERKFSCMALLETPVYKACLPSELPSGSAEKPPIFCERVRL